MRTLRICDTGLAPDTSHALHSMLKILRGRTSATWEAGTIDRADVLIAPSDADPRILDDWMRRGRPAILIATDAAEQPPSPYVLRSPLRVMPLFCILDLIAEQSPTSAGNTGEPHSSWVAAESLRSLTEGGVGGWHVARTSGGRDIWAREGHAHAPAELFERLRAGNLLVSRFVAATSEPPPDLAHMSLADVGWFIGLHGPSELAPWLSRDVSYSLRRWPDYGRLGVTPNVIELAAIAAAQPRTPDTLVELSRHDRDAVYRFLTASSLAGLLVARVTQPELPAPAAAPRWGGAWTRLVGDLRRHLGLFT